MLAKLRHSSIVFKEIFLTRPGILQRLSIMMTNLTSISEIYSQKCSLLRIGLTLNLMNLIIAVSVQSCLKKACCLMTALNGFFNAVLYGLMFKLTENNRVLKDNIEDTLGKGFFNNMSESKELLQLDDYMDIFLKKYALVNEFLEKKVSFLRVYEKREKFRYQIKKRRHRTK